MMTAFHGDEKIKQKYCAFDAYDHSRAPVEIGFPTELAVIIDRIHEGLTLDEAKLFPSRWIGAPKTGADLTHVWGDFTAWLLTDAEYGMLRAFTDEKHAASRAAIETVAQLYRDRVPRDSERWATVIAELRELSRKAWAEYYARARARARALDLALALALALDLALDLALARDLDRDLALDLALDRARARFWKACADKLVELLAAAPVQATP